MVSKMLVSRRTFGVVGVLELWGAVAGPSSTELLTYHSQSDASPCATRQSHRMIAIAMIAECYKGREV